MPKSLAALIPKKYLGALLTLVNTLSVNLRLSHALIDSSQIFNPGAHRIGCSPEEVAAWREARRKNYPTAENIARKVFTAISVN